MPLQKRRYRKGRVGITLGPYRSVTKTSEGFVVLNGPPKWGVMRNRVDRGIESDTVTGVRWASNGRMVEGLFTLPTLAAYGIWVLYQEVPLGS